MEAQMQGPKKKGKKGILIAAILVLAVAGMAVWGGQSDWFQGSLKRVSRPNVLKEKRIVPVNRLLYETVAPITSGVSEVAIDKEVVSTIEPILEPTTPLFSDLNSPLFPALATPLTYGAPLSAMAEYNDQVIYIFHVDQGGGLKDLLKARIKVGSIVYTTNNMDLKLWELNPDSNQYVVVDSLGIDFGLPVNFSYRADAEYKITADLPTDFTGKDMTVWLVDQNGNMLTDSEKTLRVLAPELY